MTLTDVAIFDASSAWWVRFQVWNRAVHLESTSLLWLVTAPAFVDDLIIVIGCTSCALTYVCAKKILSFCRFHLCSGLSTSWIFANPCANHGESPHFWWSFSERRRPGRYWKWLGIAWNGCPVGQEARRHGEIGIWGELALGILQLRMPLGL